MNIQTPTTMSEIICFYNYANTEKESGCFVLESNVGLNDLRSYLIRSNTMEATHVLLDSHNKPIETEETFTAIKEYALTNNSSISFNIASLADSKEEEEPFGPLIKQILSTLNIDYSSVEQLSDVTDNIPFPFSIMARGYLANIKANPNAIEQIVQSVAPGYSAEVAPLIAEVKHAFAFFDRKEREREEELAQQKREEEARLERERLEREKREREEQEEREREAARAKEREFFGPVMKQILDKYDVELDIDTTDIPVLVRYIPSSYKLLIQSVMKEIAANEYYINYAIRYIAQLLDVSESALVGEVQKAFKCVKDAIASQVEEEKKQEVRHHAICDKCESFIHGIRYKCLHCPDYDLCSECEENNTAHHFHDESHVFAKIHTPSNTLPSFRGCHRGGMRVDRHNRIAKLEATVEELKKAVAALSAQQ